MRTLTLRSSARSDVSVRHSVSAERTRHLARFTWCVTLGIAVAMIEGPPPVSTSFPGDGRLLFWCWIFGLSGSARILAQVVRHSGAGLAVSRLLCAIFGLVAWNQVSWGVLQPALSHLDAATSGATVGCIVAYAGVAMMQLRVIYRAAHDARFDDP